jgi:hypothetical protein
MFAYSFSSLNGIRFLLFLTLLYYVRDACASDTTRATTPAAAATAITATVAATVTVTNTIVKPAAHVPDTQQQQQQKPLKQPSSSSSSLSVGGGKSGREGGTRPLQPPPLAYHVGQAIPVTCLNRTMYVVLSFLPFFIVYKDEGFIAPAASREEGHFPLDCLTI